MVIFKIGTVDFTNYVLNDGNYKVNNDLEYVEWLDGNRVKHREPLRKRVEGSFNMNFRTKEAYQTFINTVESTRAGGYNTCSIFCNNEYQTVNNVKLFISFAPVLTQKDNMVLDYGQFQVKVEGA